MIGRLLVSETCHLTSARTGYGGTISASYFIRVCCTLCVKFNANLEACKLRVSLTMERFTWAELADMHLAYGAAEGNAVAAEALYVRRFPGREVPDRRFFQTVDRRLRETGNLKVSHADL